jgi:hypothetical protein
MHIRRFCTFLLGALLLTLVHVSANAQTGTGTPEYGPLFPINAYEEIGLSNLNLVVYTPVRSKGGPIPMSFALTENVQVYRDNV